MQSLRKALDALTMRNGRQLSIPLHEGYKDGGLKPHGNAKIAESTLLPT